MLVFGPVPSRRLGQSLGINHIPPKTCTYACVYCQVGRTTQMQLTRQSFYPVDTIVEAVREHLAALHARGEPVDYLSLVPDGEPTLDVNLGAMIRALRPLGIPVAVITNSSLLTQEAVRNALFQADWVSLKVDAADNDTWHKVDRPHGALALNALLHHAQAFAATYQGKLVTETMLVAGVNDSASAITATAQAVAALNPATAYLSIPTRPPAEPWVHAPDEASINRAYQLFNARVNHVEVLIGYEGNAFAATGDAAADLLNITAVHPMREDAVKALLAKAEADWDVVQDLVDEGALTATIYGEHRFYLRTLH